MNALDAEIRTIEIRLQQRRLQSERLLDVVGARCRDCLTSPMALAAAAGLGALLGTVTRTPREDAQDRAPGALTRAMRSLRGIAGMLGPIMNIVALTELIGRLRQQPRTDPPA